jgi:hypothetical protein
VVSVRWSLEDFAEGGRCFATGCPVSAAIPAGNRARIRSVIVEPIDDRGAYGTTHNVRWNPAPIPPALGSEAAAAGGVDGVVDSAPADAPTNATGVGVGGS